MVDRRNADCTRFGPSLPGRVPNGDFETVGGWSSLPLAGASYDIAKDLGVSACIGAQLTSCAAALQNLVSIPSTPTALEYSVKEGEQSDATVSMGTFLHTSSATIGFEPSSTAVPNSASTRSRTAGSCRSRFGAVRAAAP